MQVRIEFYKNGNLVLTIFPSDERLAELCALLGNKIALDEDPKFTLNGTGYSFDKFSVQVTNG